MNRDTRSFYEKAASAKGEIYRNDPTHTSPENLRTEMYLPIT